MGIRAGVGIGIALSFFTRAAVAKPGDERFGARGQLAIDQSFSLMATRRSYRDAGLDGLAQTNLRLAPTVSWFVLPRVSLQLGVSLGTGWYSSDGVSDMGGHTSLGSRAGLGYAVPLGERFSLWPSAGPSLDHTWFDSGDQALPDNGNMLELTVGGSVPVLWHPAPHFFVGLGPGVFAHYSGPKLGSLRHGFTMLGLTSTIGGYFSS